MSETSAFDDLVARVEQLREAVAAIPPGQPVALSRDQMLMLLEAVGRMAKGFQVLERRGQK